MRRQCRAQIIGRCGTQRMRRDADAAIGGQLFHRRAGAGHQIGVAFDRVAEPGLP